MQKFRKISQIGILAALALFIASPSAQAADLSDPGAALLADGRDRRNWEKERQKEWKEDMKERRREMRENDRERRRDWREDRRDRREDRRDQRHDDRRGRHDYRPDGQDHRPDFRPERLEGHRPDMGRPGHPGQPPRER